MASVGRAIIAYMLSLEQQEALRQCYAATRPGWRSSSQVYQDLVTDRLSPSTRVLDLGCGRGGVIERLHASSGFVAGLDPDSLSLQEHRLQGLPLIAGRAEKLPFADNTFDLAVCSWVIEHLADPTTALREVARVLRQGGAFVFLTPNLLHPLIALNRLIRGSRARVLSRFYDRAGADTFPVLYRANTPRAIRRLAQSAGLACGPMQTIGDPTYVAFTEQLFWLGRLLELVTPAAMRLHLVGVCVAA